MVWTGPIDSKGKPRAVNAMATAHGTASPARLAWYLHTGKKAPKGEFLIAECGCKACINPDHLVCVPPRLIGYTQQSIGKLKVGPYLIAANAVWGMQNFPWPPKPNSRLFGRYSQAKTITRGRWPEAIGQAVLDCGIEAIRTKLPCGHTRFDLPPGITEIPCEIPEEVYEPSHWSFSHHDHAANEMFDLHSYAS